MTKKAFATMKRGLKQTVHQGFLRLRKLHEALSIDFNEVHEILEASEYNLKMEIIEGIKEPFVVEVKMPPLPQYQNFAYREAMETSFNAAGQLPLVGETFTDSEQVKKQAELRGHSTMESMTLATGFDFFRPSHQRRAFWQVEDDDPYCQVIAFPCGPWSPLHALRARDRHRAALLKWRRKKHVKLVNFAVALARKQMRRKKHFIMENPSRSLAWESVASLKKLLEEPGLHLVEIDQCRFGLRGPRGGLHKKRTWILTSSEMVARELCDMLCDGSHDHEHVIGGNTARLAGRYPPDLAKAFVRGLERQFEDEGNEVFDTCFEANAAEAGPELGDDAPPMDLADPYEEAFDLTDDVPFPDTVQPTKAQKQAVLRLHQNTGHRSPLRLAKALAIAGACPEVIKAAKELKCETCVENRRPASHRPASLPKPRHFGDQVHVDLVAVKDLRGATFWITHGIDAVSGYQVAQMMEAKSADEVVKFFQSSWIPILGAPKVVVSDCGPEFTSDKMQACMDMHDIVLYHIPVESPWANGLAERAGGSLKVIMGKLIKDFSCQGRDDLQGALAAAVDACNADVGQTGFSPAQFVLGAQPRTLGEVIPNDLRLRLASHSLIENTPSFTRQMAMKESARVAMIKMKYSASLRRAEFSRARRAASWTTFQLGDVVYFYRVQKMAGRGTKRKRLVLNQWHGPGMIMALEGGKVPTGAYVAYRGNLTKCAIEHLRPASTLERLSAAEWEEILSEVIRASGGPDESPEDPAEPGDDHDDHDDYDPTEPDVDRDGDGGGNDEEDQDDQGGGDHPGHDGLVPRTGDAGKDTSSSHLSFSFSSK